MGEISCTVRKGTNVIERKRGSGDWAQCKRKKGAFIIIAADAVGAKNMTPGTAVDNRPFAIPPDFDSNWFHGRLTRARSVASLFIQVSRPETSRTVVAMIRAKRLCGNVELAGDASE